MHAETPSRTKMNCPYEHTQEETHTPWYSHTHTHIYPVSLWTEWTSQTFLSSSQWGQPAWPLGVTNMQFTQPDSRGSSESIHSRTRERNVQQETAAIQTTDTATMPRKATKYDVMSSFCNKLDAECNHKLSCPSTLKCICYICFLHEVDWHVTGKRKISLRHHTEENHFQVFIIICTYKASQLKKSNANMRINTQSTVY